MRCDVVSRWQDAQPQLLQDRVVAVIDVLRATTTIATALAAGTQAVWPVAEVDEAFEKAAELRNDGGEVLLAGERQNVRVEGFDLGNSPLALTPEVVDGKEMVLTTTNGTPGLAVARRHGAREIYAAALVNGPAVTAALARWVGKASITIVCAGTRGQLSLEDCLGAGLLVDGLVARYPDLTINDTARAARLAYQSAITFWPEPLFECRHAQNLMRAGFADDVQYCAQIGSLSVLPVMQGLRIQAAAEPVVESAEGQSEAT